MNVKFLSIISVAVVAGQQVKAQQTDSLQKKTLTVEEVTREKQNPMSGYETVFPLLEGQNNHRWLFKHLPMFV